MRNINAKLIVILSLAVILIPLIALPKEKRSKAAVSPLISDVGGADSTESGEQESSTVTVSASPSTVVKVYNHETEKTEKLKMEDYIYGVVAAECPMTYNEEAIKAQIVAAHTYTLYLMDKNASKKYDVSTDANVCQAYVTREKALKNWGSNSEKYDKKLKELIDEMLQYVITYKSKPIFAAYHAISSGKTEAAENIWGNEVAYLQPVESVGDKLATDYLSEKKFSYAEADGMLKPLGITAKELASGKITKTESGNATLIKCGDKEVSAADVVKALGLRSNNFDMSASNEVLNFTVRGYGHQVGMSQNGANYMAAAGSSFEEILKHYYTGVSIEKLD